MKTNVDFDLFDLYINSCCASQGAFAITLYQEENWVKKIKAISPNSKKLLLGRNAGMLDDAIRTNTEYPGDS